jgi:hypothetical protein
MVMALESIAKNLEAIVSEMRSMREEQKKFMELSKQEAEKAPTKFLEMFDSLKNITGGNQDGK